MGETTAALRIRVRGSAVHKTEVMAMTANGAGAGTETKAGPGGDADGRPVRNTSAGAPKPSLYQSQRPQ